MVFGIVWMKRNHLKERYDSCVGWALAHAVIPAKAPNPVTYVPIRHLERLVDRTYTALLIIRRLASSILGPVLWPRVILIK